MYVETPSRRQGLRTHAYGPARSWVSAPGPAAWGLWFCEVSLVCHWTQRPPACPQRRAAAGSRGKLGREAPSVGPRAEEGPRVPVGIMYALVLRC